MKRISWLVSILPLALAGCDDSTGPEGAAPVAVRFEAQTTSAASAARGGVSANHVVAPGAITLTDGTHTLVLQDIRLIVSEIELEQAEGACETVLDDEEEECAEFEGGPFLVDLLGGAADEVVTAMVPAGLYSEFEFEVEDLELDEDEEGQEQALVSLLSELRQTYPSFPSGASMVVHGTFDGEPFTVYFAAEIEVERELPGGFQIPGEDLILVNLDPASWFVAGGQVLDLRAFDGQIVEFEAEFESAVEIEIGEDD